MQVLDPFHIDLNQACLIEASAGTGKTYTITSLYARLVSMGYPVDGILVVTFTEAAAAELKLRIRERLSGCLAGMEKFESHDRENKVPDDLVAFLCRQQASDQDIIKQRIKKAVICFDQACIMTIHSFCLQTLRENAFESRAHFDIELVTDSRSFLKQVSYDFFARHINHFDPVFLKFLKQNRFTPETVQKTFGQVLSNPDLPVWPDNVIFQEVSVQYRAACDRIKWVLQNRLDAIHELIITHPGLDKRSYQKNHVRNWLNQTRERLESETAVILFNMTEKGDPIFRFTMERMASKLKEGHSLPQDEFFDLCDELLHLNRVFEDNVISLKLQFMAFFRQAHDLQKEQKGICYFDDLVSDLAGALAGINSAALVSEVRKKYQACLIDEFQDTDLKQYLIFSKLFLNTSCPFCMIGDPKQAIYAFRGGDIFAYLKAVADCQQAFTLQHNYRSDPLLVKGINHLFNLVETPFGFENIQFSPVDTPQTAINRLFENNQPVEPLQFVFLPGTEPMLDRQGFIKKEAAGKIIPCMVAQDIAGLLNSTKTLIRKNKEAHPIQPGDIAVLVRKNRQAQDIHSALADLNIPSYISKTGSVFTSAQAQDLADILKAVLEPENMGFQRAALCTGVFGRTGDDLAAMDADEALQVRWQGVFRHWKETWKQKGFFHMMNELLHSDHGLLNPDSDLDIRALTNIYHLVELIHHQAVSNHLTGKLLLKWFRDQIAQPFRETGTDELRLESDSSAVAIVTIHKSKGLEYPVVYLPYLWEGAGELKKDVPVFFHDPKENHQLTLDLGSESIEDSRAFAYQEMQAEETRLLYVALTRAVSMCRIYWGNFKSMDCSALGRMLHSGGIISEAGLLSDIDALPAQLPLSIRVETYDSSRPAEKYTPDTGTGQRLKPCVCTRQINPSWTISSFSAIAREDYFPSTPPPEIDSDSIDADRIILANFPKGPGAGDFFHSVFEDLDFGMSVEGIMTLVESKLTAFGFSNDQWGRGVARAISQILQTPLHHETPGLCLKNIHMDQRLNELEFYFKVSDFQLPKIVNVFRFKMKHPAAASYAKRLDTLEAMPFKGFIKGFIDLVFRYEGRWYILDYKSNHLGDFSVNYSADAIEEAMTAHHYFLQYHIYAVALHRYLALREKHYDYGTHFGGVFYLFFRGMHPDNNPGAGVYFDRPDEQFVKTLSDIL